VQMGLGRKGIDLLGCIPYEPQLARPSVRLVFEEIGGRLLNGEHSLENSIDTVIVGAMAAHRALEYLKPRCLLITPGDRDDLILAALSSCATGSHMSDCLSGILLTGGTMPQKNTMAVIECMNIPVILVDDDSYSAASAVNNLKVKIQPTDQNKTVLAARLVREHVDLAKITENM